MVNKKTIIKNALIVNEGCSFRGSVLIENEFIAKVYEDTKIPAEAFVDAEVIDASGMWLLPGAIDDQVHFREPGLTHKGTIATESRAAVAGGVTTYMDMPNTKPQTVTLPDWQWKMQRAAETSATNYAFFFGGTNDNLSEIHKLDKSLVPGLKLFLGSSTGNMLVNNSDTLRHIFSEADMLIAVHAEKEEIIQRNKAHYINLYGEDLDISFHTKIRSEEACYASSSEVAELAAATGARLHILHLSTAKEMNLFSNDRPLIDKKITAEVCIHHLWFTEADYVKYGNRIKWNPSIKTETDRAALRAAVANDIIDVVATDHAPHLLSEKEGTCLTAASGGPMVQHSLIAMLELARQGFFTPEKVVEKMAHHPAELFRIDRRGFIREGYYADLVLIDPQQTWTVAKENLLYFCGWSPMEGQTLHQAVWKTFVNGKIAYENGQVADSTNAMALKFINK